MKPNVNMGANDMLDTRSHITFRWPRMVRMDPRSAITFRWPRSLHDIHRDPEAYGEGPREPTYGLVIELEPSLSWHVAQTCRRCWVAAKHTFSQARAHFSQGTVVSNIRHVPAGSASACPCTDGTAPQSSSACVALGLCQSLQPACLDCPNRPTPEHLTTEDDDLDVMADLSYSVWAVVVGMFAVIGAAVVAGWATETLRRWLA